MHMPFENVHGNGGLLTTVGDLLKWNRNFDDRARGRPGADHGAAAARAADRRAARSRTRAGSWSSRYRGVPEVSHSGATAGYRAFLTRFPAQAVSVAVLCNDGNAEASDARARRGRGRSSATRSRRR